MSTVIKLCCHGDVMNVRMKPLSLVEITLVVSREITGLYCNHNYFSVHVCVLDIVCVCVCMYVCPCACLRVCVCAHVCTYACVCCMYM